MVPANSKWRKVIGFIPGVYRVKLVFKQLDFQIGVEDLRNFMIGCLRLTRNSKAYDYLIYDLKSARTHQELFGERRT